MTAHHLHDDEELALIQTRVPVTVSERFATLARERDRSVAAELRRAVRAHLERNEHLGEAA